MKYKTTLLSLLFYSFSYSQSIEIGPYAGIKYNNINNGSSNESKTNIGKNLWGAETGFQAVYNFKEFREDTFYRLSFSYNQQNRGSKSPVQESNKFDYKAKGYALTFSLVKALDQNWRINLGVGLGYNTLDNKNIYKGRLDPFVAFPKLYTKYNLDFKDHEMVLLAHLGTERMLGNRGLVAFTDINVDGGITKINKVGDSYLNQGLSLRLGIRYVLDFGAQNKL